MDYEKLYKDLFNVTKELYPNMTEYQKEKLQGVCPELAESKDERIRKALIHLINEQDGFLTAINGINVKEIVAWLEKQGEQKPTDKIEPKFKIGDWVIDKQGIVHQIANVIENVTNHTYGYDIVGGGYFNDNTEGVRLWTIQDAKDGDVLYMDNGLSTCTFIYETINNSIIQKYASYNKFGFEGRHYLILNDGYVCPATKEQCDLLFSKMKEAGYEWSAEKKELKKIEHKKEWSEEDENIRRAIINYLTPDKEDGIKDGEKVYDYTVQDFINWLNSRS